MTDDRPPARRLARLALALAVVVVAGGLGLVFFGYGAELTTPRQVTIHLGFDGIRPEMAGVIHVGDPVYGDLAGVELGRVAAVDVVEQPVIVADTAGALHVDKDPTRRRVDVTVTGPGRVGSGVIILGSQAVQAGKGMPLISDRYNFIAKILSVDAR